MPIIKVSEKLKSVSIGAVCAIAGMMAGSYVTEYLYKHNLMKNNGKAITNENSNLHKDLADKTVTLVPH